MSNINKKFIWGIAGIFILLFGHLAFASEITSDNIVKLVNQSRIEEGLPGLTVNETLSKVAQEKATDMIQNNYFAHTSPKGLTPWYWFEKNNYDYKYAGENLAISFTTSETEHAAWMASPTHRKNILNPNYKEIGVAVVAGEINGHMTIIAVQEFGTKIGETAPVVKKQENAAKDKKNILNDTTQIAPTVLSVKDTNSSENFPLNKDSVKQDNRGYFEKLSDMVKSNKDAIIKFTQIFSIYLLFMALLVMPIVFTAKSWKILLRKYHSISEIHHFKI